MNNNSEYERLVNEGYIEAGTLVIQVDDITKMQLTAEQVKATAAKQGVREDKGVVIIDKQGRMKKVSSLMFGYNKNNVQLADGNYANADELLVAMQEAISRLDAGTIIIDKKGKVLNPTELLKVVEEAAGKVKIGEQSTKVTNQDSRYWSVEGAKSDVEYKKGVVFLGNSGIDLKQGDYVSVDELVKALNDYMVMNPPIKQNSEQGQTKEQQSNVIRVARKYKNNLSRWLILSTALLVLLSGFRLKDSHRIMNVIVEYTEEIIQMIEQDQLSYIVNGVNVEITYENVEEAQRRIISNHKIGDEIELHDGDILYEHSELGGREVVIGQGLRKAGNYQISGVSIVYNGKMHTWHVDPSINNPGFEIGKFINDTCSKYAMDLDKVEIRLHMGNSSNYTRTGWIDISKIIREDSIQLEEKSTDYVIDSTHKGTIDNFSGSTITIDTVNGPVTINIVDQNGKLLESGSIVIGSDGKEYKIDNLSLSTVEVLDTKTVTKTGMQERETSDGKKLTWSIQDCSLALGIAPLLGAIAASVATKKKNEEAQENPAFFEFATEQEYLKFKKEFEEAKEKYEKTSGFKKMLKDLFYRKEVDLIQRLTEEQLQQLYSTIRNWHDGNYSYNPSDKIEFRNGKIIVTFSDGRKQDITDIIMPTISSIGKDNRIETEGLLLTEEEKENGIHR